MKKSYPLLIAVVFGALLLAGCDNEKQARMEACTKAREDATARLLGKVPPEVGREAKATWDRLQCKERDIIK